MREITQQERAAMWLYHDEYAETGLGAIEFYKRLGQYEKNNVDRMIVEICGAPNNASTRLGAGSGKNMKSTPGKKPVKSVGQRLAPSG